MKRVVAVSVLAAAIGACGGGRLSDEALAWCRFPVNQDALIGVARALDLELDLILASGEAPGGAVVSEEFAAWLETADGEKVCQEAHKAR